MNSLLATPASRWFSDDSDDSSAMLADGALRHRPSDGDWLLRGVEAAQIKTTTRIVNLDPGLYCLNIAAADEAVLEPSGIALPATHIAAPPSDRFGTAEIVAASGDSASWIGPEGGTMVIKAPLGGGHVLIAIHEAVDRLGLAPQVQIRRLDRNAFDPRDAAIDPPIATPAAAPPARQIEMEILLHAGRYSPARARGGCG